ncbi:GNAT family N-acetyltransferase [Virgibacillus senegalensis]|uniref:GNAT family N-acetyltransferase n=1 Tax=Virgibacillus senegalensis TaxID=1499679 RepID=UPI00069ED6A3|nr:GNAT family N-acetyltransferase [Virgibacillus senegalensis]
MISEKNYIVHDLKYRVRPAVEKDAEQLSKVRLQIDGETENMDRERGEDYIDPAGFRELLKIDKKAPRNLFLVAVSGTEIIGYSRCSGSNLRRTAHKVEFGLGVLKNFWGYGVGGNLLSESIVWTETNDIVKMTLSVLETNTSAIHLYKKFGFEVEGVLKNDKLLSDGQYYNTILMSRMKNSEGNPIC